MRQLLIQVRKDLKLLSTDARFVFLIVALAAIAFILSVQACSNYVTIAKNTSIVTYASLIVEQKVNLGQFWTLLMAIDSAIFIVAGSMAMTAEKDTGMLRFILTTGCDKRRFFASKFLVLTMMVGITVVISLLAYLITFAMMDMPTLGVDSFLMSLVFPTMIMLVFAAIGLLLASVSRKKSMSIVLAIFLFFVLTMTFSLSTSIGTSEAFKANNQLTVNNVTDFIPPLYKVMDLANPQVLLQGSFLSMGLAPGDFANPYNPVLYDLQGGVILGLSMLLLSLGLGYMAFRTERLDRSDDNEGIIGRILGK